MSLIGPIRWVVKYKRTPVATVVSGVVLQADHDPKVAVEHPTFAFNLSSAHLVDNVIKAEGFATIELELFSELEDNWSLKFEPDSFYLPIVLSHMLTTGDTVMMRFNATHVKTEGMELTNQRIMFYAPLEWVQEHGELDRYMTPDAKFMIRISFLGESEDPKIDLEKTKDQQ